MLCDDEKVLLHHPGNEGYECLYYKSHLEKKKEGWHCELVQQFKRERRFIVLGLERWLRG